MSLVGSWASHITLSRVRSTHTNLSAFRQIPCVSVAERQTDTEQEKEGGGWGNGTRRHGWSVRFLALLYLSHLAVHSFFRA